MKSILIVISLYKVLESDFLIKEYCRRYKFENPQQKILKRFFTTYIIIRITK